jgi:endonuclease/exonuclease/phosphatase family metal-dependent hydrolase
VRSLVAIAVAVPWVVWALLRTLGVELPYPLVALVAFTPYAALSSPLPVVVALALRRRRVAVLAGVSAALLGVAVVPRAVAGARPGASGPRLGGLSAHVWLGSADVTTLLRVAREHDVDVLSVQELRPKTVERLDRAGADEQFAGGMILAPDPGAAGTALLSRLPMDSRGVVTVRGAPPVRIEAVHPRPPVSRSAEQEWRAAIAALPGSDSRGDVRILAGDFNATLDHPELRKLLDRGYLDAADSAGAGWRPTWPAPPSSGRALPLTIDHILVDTRVRVERVTVIAIPHSDHRAVIAQLRLPRT